MYHLNFRLSFSFFFYGGASIAFPYLFLWQTITLAEKERVERERERDRCPVAKSRKQRAVWFGSNELARARSPSNTILTPHGTAPRAKTPCDLLPGRAAQCRRGSSPLRSSSRLSPGEPRRAPPSPAMGTGAAGGCT